LDYENYCCCLVENLKHFEVESENLKDFVERNFVTNRNFVVPDFVFALRLHFLVLNDRTLQYDPFFHSTKFFSSTIT
jgi:hypothetical protein